MGCVCRTTGRPPVGDCCTDAECASIATCGGGGQAQVCGCATPSSIFVSATSNTLTDTGVFLAAGSTVYVSATGSSTFCETARFNRCPSGPDGSGLIGPTCDVGVAFPCLQLVGVIGGGDLFSTRPGSPGPFFTVGSGPTPVTASTDGPLLLQIVDSSPTSYGDNTGGYEVTISCQPPSFG